MKKCSKRGCSNQFDYRETGKRTDFFHIYLIHLQGYCSKKCIRSATKGTKEPVDRVIYYTKKIKNKNQMSWHYY